MKQNLKTSNKSLVEATPTGLMEIFYGHPWQHADRLMFAHFLKELGMGFYIYGPKSDPCLRKNWRLQPSASQWQDYQMLRNECVQLGLRFGMVLSPSGLQEKFDATDRRDLQHKVRALDALGLDYIGLFFDDMKSAPQLAIRQIEIAALVASCARAKLIFCPSFYSFDPMLEVLFGEPPADYLRTLGRELPKEVEILWTGEQIISPQVSREHLLSVHEILQRKVFFCDNFFADDGPINCQILRLVPPGGRPVASFSEVSHWSFNPMNQVHLSKIAFHALAHHLRDGHSPEKALESAVRTALPKDAAEFVLAHASLFAESGLAGLDPVSLEQIKKQLLVLDVNHAAVLEIQAWLEGKYHQDFEVFAEQSGFEAS